MDLIIATKVICLYELREIWVKSIGHVDKLGETIHDNNGHTDERNTATQDGVDFLLALDVESRDILAELIEHTNVSACMPVWPKHPLFRPAANIVATWLGCHTICNLFLFILILIINKLKIRI